MQAIGLLVLGALASLLAGGCSGLHFRDEQLAKSWASSHVALSNAKYLKIYDDELTRLADYARRQDLATARMLAARTDRDFQAIASSTGSRGAASRARELGLAMQRDWDGLARLAGGNLSARQDLTTLSRLHTSTARVRGVVLRQDDIAENARRELKEVGGAPVDLSCPSVLKQPAPSSERKNAPAQRWNACSEAKRARDHLDKSMRILSAERTDLLDAYQALQEAEFAASDNGGAALAVRVAKEIDAAKAVAESGAVAKLDAFRTSLHQILDTIASPGARLVGLQAASEKIDALLTADICAAPTKFEPAAVTAAACDKVGETLLTAKAAALWAFWQALSLVADANDPRAQSASWLAGAKAIVDAAKDDAQLQAAEAKALRLVRESVLVGQVRQISALAQAQLSINDAQGARCRGGKLNCATVYFADSRNLGAITVAVLKQRTGQMRIEYGVRRERALAIKESLLIKAASDSMKTYVDAGIDPAVVGQLLFNAGLIGVAAR